MRPATVADGGKPVRTQSREGKTMKHEPEPWKAVESPSGGWDVIAGKHVMATMLTEGNARRIVASVNAFAGVATSAIEGLPAGKIADLLSAPAPETV